MPGKPNPFQSQPDGCDTVPRGRFIAGGRAMNRTLRVPAGWLALGAALAQFPAVASSDTSEDAAVVTTQEIHEKTQAKPGYVKTLEAAYGGPSQSGFGSAVFYDTLSSADDLSEAAKGKYKAFVGERWERYGEQAWMTPWKEVHVRETGSSPDIVGELRAIADRDARLSVPMILDDLEDAEAARAALSATFDDPAITELRVFNLGDGEAISGLLVAGRRGETGETTFVVFLMD